MNKAAQRQAVIEEARTWLRTPYHHRARVKGAGVDCMLFLAEVYASAGVIDPIVEIPYYPRDWMLHRGDGRYLRGIREYCRPVATPQPGDVAMFDFGRDTSHSAIVLDWPMVIHAFADESGVVISDASKGRLASRLEGFYSPWGIA